MADRPAGFKSKGRSALAVVAAMVCSCSQTPYPKDADAASNALSAKSSTLTETDQQNAVRHQRKSRTERVMEGETNGDRESKPEDTEREKPQPKIDPSPWEPDAVIDPVPTEPSDVPGPDRP